MSSSTEIVEKADVKLAKQAGSTTRMPHVAVAFVVYNAKLYSVLLNMSVLLSQLVLSSLRGKMLNCCLSLGVVV